MLGAGDRTLSRRVCEQMALRSWASAFYEATGNVYGVKKLSYALIEHPSKNILELKMRRFRTTFRFYKSVWESVHHAKFTAALRRAEKIAPTSLELEHQ